MGAEEWCVYRLNLVNKGNHHCLRVVKHTENGTGQVEGGELFLRVLYVYFLFKNRTYMHCSAALRELRITWECNTTNSTIQESNSTRY